MPSPAKVLTAEEVEQRLTKARKDFALALDRFHLAIQFAVRDVERADRDKLVEEGRFFRARFGDYMGELAKAMEWACIQSKPGEPKPEPQEDEAF